MQQTSALPRPRTADRRILIIALILGALAAGLAVAFLASAAHKPLPVEPMASVVVASKDIAAGAKIDEKMVEVKSVPQSAISAGAAADIPSVVGHIARYPISAGDQITPPRLVAPPQVQALSFQIPVGQRAFAIPVNATQSPAALVAPGDFVDVLVAGESDKIVTAANAVAAPGELLQAVNPPPGPSTGEAVTTLLQNVQVLSVESDYVANGLTYEPSTRGTPPAASQGVTYVTLSLTPEQAQLMWLASQDGKVTLTLRPFGDDKVAPVGVVKP